MTSNNLPAIIDPAAYEILSRDLAEVNEIIRLNMEGDGLDQFSLDQINVPTGGGLAWKVPTADGPRMQEVVEGVIVHFNDPRAYFPDAFTGEKQMPACRSIDGVRGVGTPGGACAACRYNAWGSDPKGGDGKACKEKRFLFVLQPRDLMPVAIVIPPSSLANVRAYFRQLTRAGRGYWSVVTTFKLAEAKSKSGVVYSEVVLNAVRQLEPEQTKAMREYGESLALTISTTVDPAPAGAE